MRKILALGLAVLVVIVLWTGGWFWAASTLRGQVELLAANDGETAPKAQCATMNITGFPFRLDLDCQTLTVTFGDHEVTLAALRASVQVDNPAHVLFSAKAPYAMTNAFTGSQSRFDFDDLSGSARLTARDLFAGFSGEGWRIARISIVADNVAWYDTVLEDLLQAKVSHAELHLLDMPEVHDKAAGTAGLALYTMAEGLNVPSLTITDASTTLEADLTGLPDDLQRLGDPDLLQRWQQNGGLLKLVNFTGSQPVPDDHFEASGEASLSAGGLLNAQLSYVTKGVFERLGGMLPTTTLAMFRGAPEPDGSFRNELNIVDGKLNALAMTMMDIPPLW